MVELIPIIGSLVLFLFVMLIFSREKLDYAVFALLAAIIACLLAYFFFRTDALKFSPEENPLTKFLSFVEFDAILFLISMQIIVSICEENKLFQWLALKVLHLVGGNHRLFFYLICTVSALTAALISDITIAIIFVPLVIRATRILKIKTAPYIFGISFTVNIGSIYTPFSSAENILIASAEGFENMTTVWFLSNFSLFVFPILLITLFAMDMIFIRKIEPPKQMQKTILLEIMSPEIVIVNKKQFILNWIYFGLIIIGLIIVPHAYLVAVVGVVLISILNRKQFAENLKQVDWKLITFLFATFLLIGTMQINDTFSNLNGFIEKVIPENQLLAGFVVLISISILSGVLAQVPTALVMIAVLQQFYGTAPGAIPPLVQIGFILGINIGSNFLPQGAAVDLMALNLAKKNKVEGFNYKTLLRNGSIVTLFHIVNSMIYMSLYYLVMGCAT